MKSNRASVVITGYKFSEFFKNILDNLKIIPESWQVVFVDNNEDDNESKKLEEFLNYHQLNCETIFLHCPIAGLAPARNYGSSKAKYDIIFYLDVDDPVINTQNLKNVVEDHLKNNSDLTLVPAETNKKSLARPNYHPKKFNFIKLEKYLYQKGQYNILLSKKVLTKIEWGNHFFVGESAGAFIIKTFTNGFKVAISNLKCTFYNESNLSSITRRKLDNYRSNELAYVHLDTLKALSTKKIKSTIKVNIYKFITFFKIIYYGIFKSNQPYFFYISNIRKDNMYISMIFNFIKIKIIYNNIKTKFISKCN